MIDLTRNNACFLIPARSGSKGIVGKNLVNLDNKPLILHTIEAAKNSSADLNIYVSTDGNDIADVAKLYGAKVPYLRSKELSNDNAATIDVVIDFFNRCEYEYVILLQPTSPLRTAEDINNALSIFCSGEFESLVSTQKIKFNKDFQFDFKKDSLNICKPIEVTRRQDWQMKMIPNGAIYIASQEILREKKTFYTQNTAFYEMDDISSIDIDKETDVQIAESILKYLK